MSTTYTPNLHLGKPAVSDRNWNVANSGNFDTIEALAPVSMLNATLAEYPSASLHIVVAPGSFINAALVYKTYAGGTVTIAASSTIHVWLTDAGAIGQGVAWPTAGTNHVRIATVVTGAATVTSITDERTAFRSVSS